MREDIEYGPGDDAEQDPKHSIVGLIWASMKSAKRKLIPAGSSGITPEYSVDAHNRSIASAVAAHAKKLEVSAMREDSSYTDEYHLVPIGSSMTDSEAEQAAVGDEISPEEAAWLLELKNTAEVAPRLSDQLADDEEDRGNIITYIAGLGKSLGTKTSEDSYRGDRAEITEYEMLRQLDEFLAKMEGSLGGKYADDARSIRDKLTFIGEKEYKKAAAGIAANWKAVMEADADLQICVIAGEIAKLKDKKTDDKTIYGNQIKSDEYLLEAILANFSEEDWEEYGGRVLVDRDDIAQAPKEHLRVVLLDDWTISGWQLRKVYISLIGQYPEIRKQIEVQLITANKQRIEQGLAVDWLYTGEKLPVKAYYSAHYSKTAARGAHITGSHSTSDFDFEVTIARMVKRARSLSMEDVCMPPGTNIVRPYRKDGVTRDSLVNIERARQYRRRRLAERQENNRAIL